MTDFLVTEATVIRDRVKVSIVQDYHHVVRQHVFGPVLRRRQHATFSISSDGQLELTLWSPYYAGLPLLVVVEHDGQVSDATNIEEK